MADGPQFGSDATSDLYGRPDRRKELGYTTDSNSYVDDSGFSGPQQSEAGFYGGRDYDIDRGRLVPGSDGAGRAAERYRRLGRESLPPAVRLNQQQADASRGLVMGGLGNIKTALAGGAPSQAALNARLAGEQSLAASSRALGGASGGAGAVVAAHRGGEALGTQAVAQGGAALDARAKEAGADRGALLSGASGLRAGDIDAATVDAQLEARRREMTDTNEQFYERMGLGVDLAAQNAWLERKKLADQAAARRRAEIEADRQGQIDDAVAGVSTVAKGVTGAVSDRRAKYELDMGSLGKIGRR